MNTKNQRIGLGEDRHRHRFGQPGSGPLRLGEIDVLLHAITDALLGVLG